MPEDIIEHKFIGQQGYDTNFRSPVLAVLEDPAPRDHRHPPLLRKVGLQTRPRAPAHLSRTVNPRLVALGNRVLNSAHRRGETQGGISAVSPPLWPLCHSAVTTEKAGV